MIKRLIDKIFGKTASQDAATARKSIFGRRREVPSREHGIDPQMVDKRAVEVVRTLKEHGFDAYIVGGAVRDLLLGFKPKDFDVATNATPEEVKKLFRRAFIIGRRFRIVHVVFGRGREHEVVEVSTFRAYLDNDGADRVSGHEHTSKRALEGMTHAVDASGRVLRDNVWGSQEEDAARRDFTLNAMYYDPERQIVVDYHDGIKDAKKKIIRMIGDPASRYREDPVRIIRAVRFSAKLCAKGFALDKKTAAPLLASQTLLSDVPQSRLFDEMLKLLQTGHARATVEQLRKLGLQQGIYPLLDLVVARSDTPLVNAALKDTDRRVGEGKSVAPSFLLACVLWSDVRDAWQRRQKGRQPSAPALLDAIDEIFHARIGDVSGRGKLAADMRDIWVMQSRFEKRTGKSPYALIDQPRFRAGFDFMRLRADVGDLDEALSAWWVEFTTADEWRREDLIAQVREEQRKRPRQNAKDTKNKAPSRAQPATARYDAQDGSAAGDAADSSSGADSTPAEAPAKKRRRRRKPSRARSASPGHAADTQD